MYNIEWLFKEKTQKKVCFNDHLQLHIMCVWSYAYKKARHGEWEQVARDRERFRFRIERVGKVINPVLEKHFLNVQNKSV